MPEPMSARRCLGLVKASLIVLLVAACGDPMTLSSGSVLVTPTGQTVPAGEAVRVFATGQSSGGGIYALGKVTWSSSDESIARVTSSRIVDLLGLGAQVEATVLGVSAGTATITAATARAGEGEISVTGVP